MTDQSGKAHYSHWELFKSDFRRYESHYVKALASPPDGWRRWGVRAYLAFRTQGIWASADFRFGHWVSTGGPRLLKPLSVVVHLLTEVLTGIGVSHRATVGPGLYIAHYGNIMVSRHTTIGAGCNIGSGVTLGYGMGSVGRGGPTVGDAVFIAPGAKVFGPVNIGSGAIVGANAVVTGDVPDNAVVAGVPAKVIRILDPEDRAKGGYASVGLD